MKPFEVLTTKQLIARLDKFTFKQLHIHHTWKPNHSNFDGKNHIKLQNGMYDYHMSKGWIDIGQHVTLAPDGKWVTGRDFDDAPASISGWNLRAFAVEMLGDFDIGQDSLEGEQRLSILELTAYFIKRFGEDCVKFHREGPDVTKTCPGTGINKEIFMREAKWTMGRAFKDVDDARWSAKHIEAAKELGIVKGDDKGMFNPSDPITREEATVLMMRTFEAITGRKVVT